MDENNKLMDRSSDLSKLSRELSIKGEPLKALELLLEAEQLRRMTFITESLPSLLIAKTGLLVQLDRLEEALNCLKEAEKICKELNDINCWASVLGFRIEILKRLGLSEEIVIQVGRKVCAELGLMPSDTGLPPEYWI
jgi:flagellar biosynthesis/type III secretory pathway chaperone